MENSIYPKTHSCLAALNQHLGTSLLHRYSAPRHWFPHLRSETSMLLPCLIMKQLRSHCVCFFCWLSKTTEVVMVGKEVRGNKVAFFIDLLVVTSLKQSIVNVQPPPPTIFVLSHRTWQVQYSYIELNYSQSHALLQPGVASLAKHLPACEVVGTF